MAGLAIGSFGLGCNCISPRMSKLRVSASRSGSWWPCSLSLVWKSHGCHRDRQYCLLCCPAYYRKSKLAGTLRLRHVKPGTEIYIYPHETHSVMLEIHNYSQYQRLFFIRNSWQEYGLICNKLLILRSHTESLFKTWGAKLILLANLNRPRGKQIKQHMVFWKFRSSGHQ